MRLVPLGIAGLAVIVGCLAAFTGTMSGSRSAAGAGLLAAMGAVVFFGYVALRVTS